MLVLITKASDDYWYKFKEVNTIEDLLKINSRLIIQKNYHTKNDVEFWDGFKKEDIENLKKAKIEVVIYDSYVE